MNVSRTGSWSRLLACYCQAKKENSYDQSRNASHRRTQHSERAREAALTSARFVRTRTGAGSGHRGTGSERTGATGSGPLAAPAPAQQCHADRIPAAGSSWQGNQLAFRAAVAAKAQGANTETFGVIWGSARTEVDRVARQVTLEDLHLTRSNFPTLPDNGAAYLSELQQPFQGAARTIALDRLEASLAASGTAPPSGVPVQNDPPQILVSNSPALLVPIDGRPVLRSVPNTQFERVINTRVLILRAQGSGTYYLHVYDGWLSASTVEGPGARSRPLRQALTTWANSWRRAGRWICSTAAMRSRSLRSPMVCPRST